MKMQPYRFFYAIQPRSLQSRWFDSLIKVDVKNPNGIFVHNVLLYCEHPHCSRGARGGVMELAGCVLHGSRFCSQSRRS